MRRNYFQLHLGLNGKIPPTPFSPFVPSPIPGQWSSHATDEFSHSHYDQDRLCSIQHHKFAPSKISFVAPNSISLDQARSASAHEHHCDAITSNCATHSAFSIPHPAILEPPTTHQGHRSPLSVVIFDTQGVHYRQNHSTEDFHQVPNI